MPNAWVRATTRTFARHCTRRKPLLSHAASNSPQELLAPYTAGGVLDGSCTRRPEVDVNDQGDKYVGTVSDVSEAGFEARITQDRLLLVEHMRANLTAVA